MVEVLQRVASMGQQHRSSVCRLTLAGAVLPSSYHLWPYSFYDLFTFATGRSGDDGEWVVRRPHSVLELFVSAQRE